MTPLEAGAAATAAGLAGFVHGMAGFGSALVALPIMCEALGVRTAVPLACVMGFCINAMLLPGLRGHIQRQALVLLILFSIPGMLLGGWFLGRAPDDLLKTGIGLALLYMALRSIRPARPSSSTSPGLTAVAGMAAGFLGVATATSGPPVLVWAARQPWNAKTLKATLVGYFMITGVGILSIQAYTGLFTGKTFTLLAAQIPALALGVCMGRFCFSRMSDAAFRRLFFVLLGIMGTVMLWQSGLKSIGIQ